MTVTIYGIKTCDTMKKALSWLTLHGVEYRFHDYRADGISRQDVARWCGAAGWQKVLNRSSTTFRALPDSAKTSLDEAAAIDLMVDEPTMIKRPVLETGRAIEVGFKPERYASIFSA